MTELVRGLSLNFISVTTTLERPKKAHKDRLKVITPRKSTVLSDSTKDKSTISSRAIGRLTPVSQRKPSRPAQLIKLLPLKEDKQNDRGAKKRTKYGFQIES